MCSSFFSTDYVKAWYSLVVSEWVDKQNRMDIPKPDVAPLTVVDSNVDNLWNRVVGGGTVDIAITEQYVKMFKVWSELLY